MKESSKWNLLANAVMIIFTALALIPFILLTIASLRTISGQQLTVSASGRQNGVWKHTVTLLLHGNPLGMRI